MELEELQNKLLEAQDKIKELEQVNTTLTTENTQYKQKITDLQEHNHRLFLRLQVGPEPTTKTEEVIPPPTYEDIANRYKEMIK